MIIELLTIIAPVMVCAIIGFVWCKKGLSFDVEQVTTLVTYIGTPCLVFTTLTNVEIERSAFTEMALGTAVSVTSFGVFGAIILRVFGMHLATYLPPVVRDHHKHFSLHRCSLLTGFIPHRFQKRITKTLCCQQLFLRG